MRPPRRPIRANRSAHTSATAAFFARRFDRQGTSAAWHNACRALAPGLTRPAIDKGCNMSKLTQRILAAAVIIGTSITVAPVLAQTPPVQPPPSPRESAPPAQAPRERIAPPAPVNPSSPPSPPEQAAPPLPAVAPPVTEDPSRMQREAQQQSELMRADQKLQQEQTRCASLPAADRSQCLRQAERDRSAIRQRAPIPRRDD